MPGKSQEKDTILVKCVWCGREAEAECSPLGWLGLPRNWLRADLPSGKYAAGFAMCCSKRCAEATDSACSGHVRLAIEERVERNGTKLWEISYTCALKDYWTTEAKIRSEPVAPDEAMMIRRLESGAVVGLGRNRRVQRIA